MALPSSPVETPGCQLNWEYLAGLFRTVESTSSAIQGPGAVGTPVVYTSVEINIGLGTWVVYGCASMSSQTAADAKRLNLFNQTTGATILNSSAPVQDVAAVNINQSFTTVMVLTISSDTKIRLQGQQNGASQITFGTAFAGGAVQRLTALKVK